MSYFVIVILSRFFLEDGRGEKSVSLGDGVSQWSHSQGIERGALWPMMDTVRDRTHH